ncbi:MAG: CDP-diacylglycerol--glycerol-3-phosphate 3-phosphatidyltransferase [Rhodospirillales bacterium]|nr:CDP-diacylglycerol--glycerol-3-phosphate 3-phosphatidyltransferase [Rhodospirillales bacterium]
MIPNLANILTLGRLALLPFIIVLLSLPFGWAAWACLTLYAAAAVTDFLDGWVARKYDQITPFGTFMDPISDKIFVVTILMMLIAVDRISGIFVLAVIVILAREFTVSGLREFLGPKEVKLPVTNLAKWKTTVQMIATGCLIVGPYDFTLQVIGLAGITAAAALTAYTGWLYVQSAKEHIIGTE